MISNDWFFRNYLLLNRSNICSRDIFLLWNARHNIRNNRSLYKSFAYGYWELDKIAHLKKVFTFVCIWTALIGLAIAES